MMEFVFGSAIICTVGLVEPSFCVLVDVVFAAPAEGFKGDEPDELDEKLLCCGPEVELLLFAMLAAGLVLSSAGRVTVPIVVPTLPLKLAEITGKN